MKSVKLRRNKQVVILQDTSKGLRRGIFSNMTVMPGVTS